MEVKVIKPFCDKFNLSRLFTPGEIVNFEEKRAENIVSRGLGEIVKAKKEPKPKVEAPKAEAPKAEVPTQAEQVVEESAAPKKRGRKTKKESE